MRRQAEGPCYGLITVIMYCIDERPEITNNKGEIGSLNLPLYYIRAFRPTTNNCATLRPRMRGSSRTTDIIPPNLVKNLIKSQRVEKFAI